MIKEILILPLGWIYPPLKKPSKLPRRGFGGFSFFYIAPHTKAGA
jgi:hypothetical protein